MTDWRLHSADYTPGGPVTPLAVYAEAYAAALPTRQQPPAGTDNASLRRLYNFGESALTECSTHCLSACPEQHAPSPSPSPLPAHALHLTHRSVLDM